MFGSETFGAVPFGGAGATIFDHDAMLEASYEELVYTVTMTVWHMATDVASTLTLGSAEWATAPTDVPASVSFDGRLRTVLSYRRSVVDAARLGINFTSDEGTITFDNSDGAYDAYFRTYAVDGRPVSIKVGRKTDAYANHLTIFTGTIVDWEDGDDEVRITVRDNTAKLDVPASPNIYAGTGGAEGGTDLKGKRKPLTFGFCYGVPATPVDPANLIYQVHDDAAVDLVSEALSVYDRGVALTSDSPVNTYADLVAASPAAGHFVRSRDGFYRLGAVADGVVFGNVSSTFAAIYPSQPSAARIVRALLEGVAGMTSAEIDGVSLDRLDVAQSSPIQVYVSPDEAQTIKELLDRVMAGLGGWVGVNRLGQIEVGRFDAIAPSEPTVATYSYAEGDIISLGIARLPDGVWPPPWRWRVAWGRNFTVFSDFAGSVSDSVRTYYAEPYRLAESSSSAIVTDHPQALDVGPVEAHFQGESAALSEAGRLRGLYQNNRRLFSVVVGRQGLRRKLGEVIKVVHPRFGMTAGRRMRIAEIEDGIEVADGSTVEQVTLLAYEME